ncbi:hypothetical protein A6M57_8925 [Staphylococcus pseudintermedius]|nr:hypothetical protein A6M57_8925 [Staphylococcus pseudintermedius]
MKEKENGIYNYNNYIHILFIIGIHTISILYIYKRKRGK